MERERTKTYRKTIQPRKIELVVHVRGYIGKRFHVRCALTHKSLNKHRNFLFHILQKKLNVDFAKIKTAKKSFKRNR
jgi:hypothetical protein